MTGRSLAAAASLSVIALAAAGCAGPSPGVRVWHDTRTIPTYEEGPPDPNPPFDLFAGTRFNYPYTMRTRLTDRRVMRAWRTLNLENEFLKVQVVPDLGGHVLSVVDKATGRELFYANPSLKFAQVAYRGAWASYGIEFNFPVSHSWVTVSPVDFATRVNPDGSASIVVGNVDLVYGMQWRVELTLRPARAALEQQTRLYNRSDVRHRFYWWTNAAVQVWDDSEICYPMTHTASHGFSDVDTWPVNRAGVDLSRPGNHRQGPVSLFAHGSREPFMGIYHPRTRAGVAHYSAPSDLPAKKVWSWGADADGLEWRKALSDDDSAVAEIQAGLFRNQETYAFLEPQESIAFEEAWLPVRGIGGISRANAEAVLHVARAADGGGQRIEVGLNVARAVRGVLTVRQAGTAVAEEQVAIGPRDAFVRAFSLAGSGPCTVRLSDASGRPVIEHTEGVYDVTPAAQIKVGPQAAWVPPPPAGRSEADEAAVGRAYELEGKLLKAYAAYAEGLARFPGSFELLKASGRLAVDLKRFDEASDPLERALARVSNDAEAQYYLGCARLALGDAAGARALFEQAAFARAMRAPALSQLVRLAAREGRLEEALGLAGRALQADPGAVRTGTFEIILLRRMGRDAQARRRLEAWLAADPANGTLRVEATRLGPADERVWAHLGSDPQRVLDVAIDYMDLGDWADAIDVLGRRYPTGAAIHAEPGAVAPQRHPEVAYYRGYCREMAGRPGRADFEAASRMSTAYVFPQRAASMPVLSRAAAADPSDATARFLLASLYLSGGMAERAAEQWEAVRRLRPNTPTLHRNLGMTVLYALGDARRAEAVLSEGLTADPLNPDVYLALDQASGLVGRPPLERLRALERYPALAETPPAIVFKRALALVEAGRPAEAEAQLAGRFFPREEFGTNVRQVYVEIREQQALALARQRRCGEATGLVRRLGEGVEALPFTKTGMSAFTESGRALLLGGEVMAACGERADAAARWRRAAALADAYPSPNVAFGWRAMRRLGEAEAPGERGRLEAALAGWERRLVIGTNFPGPNACGRGMLLLALGRGQEARERLEESLLLPDQLMSHYLAREALAGAARGGR